MQVEIYVTLTPVHLGVQICYHATSYFKYYYYWQKKKKILLKNITNFVHEMVLLADL